MRPALIFDLDGVLADSTGPITTCLNRALAANGHRPRPAAELYGFIGPPGRLGFAGLLGTPPDAPEVEACLGAYRDCYAVALRATPPYPGVPQAVRALGRDFRLAVATTKPLIFARPVIQAIGLDGAFEVVRGPALETDASKRETVGAAIEALGGGAVAMVGDRRYDMEAARHHGLRAIGVTWGFGSREELLEAGAEVLVDSPAGLLDAVPDGRTPRRPAPLPPAGG